MQQRLGLARALVHDPQVLLLDEPAAGLDPRARVEMQELVRELRRMGKTVLISSHILPELEEMCTWVGFIDHGRMVAAGPMEQVRGQAATARRVRVELDDPSEEAVAAAEDTIGALTGAVAVSRAGRHLEVALAESVSERDFLRQLVQADVPVRAYGPAAGSLAEAFLRLTTPEPVG